MHSPESRRLVCRSQGSLSQNSFDMWRQAPLTYSISYIGTYDIHKSCINGGSFHFVEHTHTRDFSSFVSTINRQLKPLGMELARGNLENSGETWYSVVNRSEDAAAKIAAAYSPAELELFNKAVSKPLYWVQKCSL